MRYSNDRWLGAIWRSIPHFPGAAFERASRTPPRRPRALDRGLLQGRAVHRMTTTRRRAAILAADVAGYSRLIGADEEGTLGRLKALRAEGRCQVKQPQ